ncbi:LINE-1 retrotransposable element ORF1 protein [Plecturocebus cupreus]
MPVIPALWEAKGSQLLIIKGTKKENESDELTEAGFRRWVITNSSELKDHVLTQCKETKNLEKRLDEMLTRITNLVKNINDLMELKNTTRELHQACTSFKSRINQAEERISETEDQINEIKQEGKIREKRVKRNEQSLQELWDYVKIPNLRLIGIPNVMGRMNPSWKTLFKILSKRTFPT